jgi:hypothetical protein
MPEETEENIPSDPGNKLPATLDSHLRTVMTDTDLKHFREQLPADFLADAAEGLDQLKDTTQMESVFQQLNQQMHHQLVHKKLHRKRRNAGYLTWSYWAIIIVLLLCFTGFMVIRYLLHR